MKYINEWRAFLKEENFISHLPMEVDEDGNVTLYHVSSTKGIKEFDPDIAAASAQNYTTRDYVTWNRPRVFFFTKKGQQDTGLGKIPGESFYKVKVPVDKIYPVMEDPAQLSSKQRIQEYMISNVPAFEKKYKKAEKCDPNKDYNQWHICSKVENSDGLAWYEERFMGKKLLIDNPRFHSDKPNVYELVAQLSEERFGTIGFVYPQDSNDKDSLIVAIWRPVKALEVDKFY